MAYSAAEALTALSRQRKFGAALLAAMAVAFSMPFFFHSTIDTEIIPPPATDKGNEADNETTLPLDDDSSTVSWSGWKGLCHGQGRHYGILKKALRLNFTLPVC